MGRHPVIELLTHEYACFETEMLNVKKTVDENCFARQ
jgi:hypothetical protein